VRKFIQRVPAWNGHEWLSHGFGTMHSPGWTRGPARTWVHQTHSADVIRADLPGFHGDGDAIVTNSPGLLLEVRTADCVPILLVDSVRQVVAAVHAGWRGSAARIAERTVTAMSTWFQCDPADIQAAIGPAIGPCCYEVGPEVAEQFGKTGRQLLDLISWNEQILHAAGVRTVILTTACTKCHSNEFHSFRRDGERAGRMESGIGLYV
jgi:YfiH family protein